MASILKSTIAGAAKGIAEFRAHYHATRETNKRRVPITKLSHEDDELRHYDRKKLTASTHDARRNMTVLQWMVNVHLDSITSLNFQSKSGLGKEFDSRFESLMKRWSRKGNCEVSGRHSFRRFTRLHEAGAVIDGDHLWIPVSGGKLQAIEGNRIASDGMTGIEYGGRDKTHIEHGLHFDPTTDAILEFAIGSRWNSQLRFERWVSARRAWYHGYYVRTDQRRGVSPLASALNTIVDVYEGFDSMLIKTKIMAMMGLILFADRPLQTFDYTDAETGQTATSATDASDVEFSLQDGLLLNLPADAKAEVIESNTPHQGWIDWESLCIQVACLALDIPITFFDSRKSSFSARGQDVQRYEEACKDKRENLIEDVDGVTDWKASQWLFPGGDRPAQLTFPDGNNTPEKIFNFLAARPWRWSGKGLPWVDYLKERNGDLIGLATCMASPYKLAAQRGEDLEETLDDLERFWTEIQERGIPVPEFQASLANAVAAGNQPTETT